MTLQSLRHRIALKRGSNLLRKERWQQAAPLLKHATRLAPNHWESQNNLAIALLKLGRFEEAATVAQRAIALDPGASDSHAFFGIALLKLERWEEAVAAYHRAIAVDPDRYDSYERLGMALTRLGRWTEVADAYATAVSLAPSSHAAHNVLGTALLQLGRWDEAAASFRRAIELVPKDPAASEDLASLLINLASAVAKLHKSEDAVTALRQAASLHPSAGARLSLAVELLKCGQWEDALSELDAGMAHAPELAGFHFLRVDPLIKLGRLQEAMASHRRAVAVTGPMPPLPGESAATRFEQRLASFWTPDNLGRDVFEVERWLQELSAVPAAPSASPTRPARLLFVLDNDYGELTTLMYFVLGQGLSHRATLLLPERLYPHNRDAIPGRTHRYASLEDVLAAVDREQPDIVFLCSGYLFSAHNIFTAEILERLIRLLRERGCRVVTSDPFLGMLSKQDPRTLISIDIPMNKELRMTDGTPLDPVLARELLTRAKRADEERMWAYYTQSEKTLRDTYHLYPAYPDIAAHDLARTDARNVAFFNSEIVRPAGGVTEATAGNATPHWLFILATADYDTQVLFEGETGFTDIVASKLVEALAAGRHPILVAPSQFVEKLMARMPTADGIDILSHCPFTQFMSLLLSAEHAFYWNVVSHSLLIRLFNQLPIVVFDRGHLVRNARGILERIVGWYYQGWEPPFRDHREPLTLETVARWSADYRKQATQIAARFRRAPSPAGMIEDLMARKPVPAI